MIDIICMALDQSVSPHTDVRAIQNAGVFWQAVFQLGGWNREKLRDIPICFRRITFITPRKPIPRTEHVT